MKVYIVGRDDCLDCGHRVPIAVFSEQAKAEEIAASLEGGITRYYVEEFELDSLAHQR